MVDRQWVHQIGLGQHQRRRARDLAADHVADQRVAQLLIDVLDIHRHQDGVELQCGVEHADLGDAHGV